MTKTTPRHGDAFVLSLGQAGDGLPVSLSGEELRKHVAVIDTRTGMLDWEHALLRETARAGGASIVLDLWPSADRPAQLAGFLRAAGRGRSLYQFAPANPGRSESWNPLRRGTAEQVANKLALLLPSGRMDAAEKVALQASLTAVVAALQAAKLGFTLGDVALLLRYGTARAELAERLPAGAAQAAFAAWSEQHKRPDHASVRKGFSELAKRIDALLATECGRLLNVAAPTIDFGAVLAEGACLYVPLAISEEPEARTVLRLMFAEMAVVFAQRDAKAIPALICLSDAARHVAVDRNLLAAATAAQVCFVAGLRADEVREPHDFIGALFHEAGTQLVAGGGDFTLGLLARVLGAAPDDTLVVRHASDAMQLVRRPQPVATVAAQFRSVQRRAVTLGVGERAFGLEARASEFVPPPTGTRHLYAVGSTGPSVIG